MNLRKSLWIWWRRVFRSGVPSLQSGKGSEDLAQNPDFVEFFRRQKQLFFAGAGAGHVDAGKVRLSASFRSR